MTERLYYMDSYCTRFSARVIEQCVWEDRPAVVLDRTAFYPASGGQPSDRGMLGGVMVLDVVVRDRDSAVVHVLECVLSETEVEGVVDWPRRFDHMQQHTGQHVLSAAFEKLLDADTVGFHLGAEVCTVDVNLPRLELAAARPVEELTNRVIWEDRPVRTRFVGADELAALPLRRPPAVEGAVRIVDIAGPAASPEDSFDVNPCGGTHVARTGEVGLVKIVRLNYRGEETRVEFLCGGRALRDYESKDDMVSRLANALTVGYWELDQAVERLQAEAKKLRKDLSQARKQLAQVEVSELVDAARVHGAGAYRVVCKVWERAGDAPGKSPEELRILAQELAQRSAVVALLAGVGDDRTHLVFARHPDTAAGLDVAALLRDACAQLEGKGGGQSNFAQGSAPTTDAARVQTVLWDMVSS
jgi:alanyl-tRNA synthetase